jgi:hypothetical protein
MRATLMALMALMANELFVVAGAIGVAELSGRVGRAQHFLKKYAKSAFPEGPPIGPSGELVGY